MANRFNELLRLTQGKSIAFSLPRARLALCPTLTGRVFVEVDGRFLHRTDMETAAHPDKPFNNLGGNNLWPAPEGGTFGFNYRGNQWCVQPCINAQPFTVLRHDAAGAVLQKEVGLVNRAGTELRVLMKREARLTPAPTWLKKYAASMALCYATTDSFTILNEVPAEKALIAAWTLEQFDATDDTLAFCLVEQPGSAINFDFYAHPGERIVCHRQELRFRRTQATGAAD